MSMQGKYQRTENVDFLGNKYRTFTCTICKEKYEDMAWNKDRKCPPCTNITLDEYVENGMDYSKSFDECFSDQAKLVGEWHRNRK